MSAEIKEQIEKIGKTWEEAKKVNDAILEKQEKLEGGQAELKEKQAKIDEALNNALEMKERLDQTQKAVARMANAREEMEEKTDLTALNAGLKAWGKNQKSFDPKSAGLNDVQVKALQSNIMTQGGYFTSPFIGGIEKIVFDTSEIRSLATVRMVGQYGYEGKLKDQRPATTWAGEKQTVTETATADIKKFRIDAKEMIARIPVSNIVLEDSDFDLVQDLTEDLVESFSIDEETAFVLGTGNTQPIGLMTAEQKTSSPEVNESGKIGTKVVASASDITLDELIDLESLLKNQYKRNATWVFNRFTRALLRKKKNSQGDYLWQPSFTAGVPDQFMASPVSIAEDMPSVGANALAVGYGDIRSTYMIVDRLGMSTLEDPFTQADSGEVVFHFRRRVGGGFKNYDAFKYLKMAAS